MFKDSILAKECEFRISNLSVSRRTVIPPVPYVCFHNHLLFDRFFYVTKGKILFNNGIECPKGHLLYIPYNYTYESRWDIKEEGEYISINFILTDKDGQVITVDDKMQHVLHDKKKDFLPLFENIHKIWTEGAFGYKTKSLSMLYELFNKLLLYNSSSTSKDKMYRAIHYLENNYLEDIPATQLAEMAMLGESMFRRNFKQITGMTPVQYKNELRLKKAYEMLTSGEFSITETALITNFNDLSYFNRMFKKQYGVNPSNVLESISGHQ